MKQFLTFLLLLAFCWRAEAQTMYWTNSAGGDYYTAGNWTNDTASAIQFGASNSVSFSPILNNTYQVDFSASATNNFFNFVPLAASVNTLKLNIGAGNTFMVSNGFPMNQIYAYATNRLHVSGGIMLAVTNVESIWCYNQSLTEFVLTNGCTHLGGNSPLSLTSISGGKGTCVMSIYDSTNIAQRAALATVTSSPNYSTNILNLFSGLFQITNAPGANSSILLLGGAAGSWNFLNVYGGTCVASNAVSGITNCQNYIYQTGGTIGFSFLNSGGAGTNTQNNIAISGGTCYATNSFFSTNATTTSTITLSNGTFYTENLVAGGDTTSLCILNILDGATFTCTNSTGTGTFNWGSAGTATGTVSCANFNVDNAYVTNSASNLIIKRNMNCKTLRL